ncbi:unnamed protein product [Brachionus calyciflorus]|uniref:Reverse transcriptase domain-containing protein n=1 Tax=Brachionus calyciflorus TaxID=104777 RepID=A0A813M8U6_9BILA|nr:unnamed protein product [Brachionus calyciflorus]
MNPLILCSLPRLDERCTQNLENTKPYFKNRKRSAHGGGAFYVEKNLSSFEMNQREFLNESIEKIWYTLTYELDKGFNVDIVYTDFSKDFDKVSHRNLLRKLKEFGIHGTAICNVYKRSTNDKDKNTIDILQKTDQEKDLGIYITTNLKCRKQCPIAAAKANRDLGQIKNSFSFLERNTFKLLYNGLVRSHLEFAVGVWCHTSKGDIEII